MRKSLKDWCRENNSQYLLSEWDVETNGILDEKLSYGSEKKVSWKCEKEHTWLASINQRTSTKSMCPYCSGRYAIPGETDLENLYPEIAIEWDKSKNKLTPNLVKPASHDKVWWICKKCGHEWNAVISSRTSGIGCPQCGREKISHARSAPKEGNSLSARYPQLAAEWNVKKNGGITSGDVSAMSHRKVWWICNNGHEWQAMVSNRVKGRNCPYCSNKKIIAGHNDFATIYPHIAEEWNYEKNIAILPTEISPSSSKTVWWKCNECGHEWVASVNNRIKRGCPECSKARRVSFPEKIIFFYIMKVFKDVEENYRPDFLNGQELDIYIPEIQVAIEYDGELYHQNINRDIHKNELCRQNNIFLLRVREPGCPKLNDKNYVVELVSRNTEDYEKMVCEIFNVLQEKGMMPNTSISVDLKRDSAEINRLVNYRDIGCSISVTNPELKAFWNSEKNKEFTMDKVTYASDKLVWWKCQECEYEWYGKVYSMTRKKGKNLCPKCKKEGRD